MCVKYGIAVNKVHFIEGVDYFNVTQPSEIRTLGLERPQGGTPESVTLITESGYLMLVKSFTDDLAWAVQRQLVNTYFRAHGVAPDLDALSPTLRVLINLELEQKEQAKAIEAVNQKVDDIRDVVALSPNSWRPNARSLIARIAQALGGNEYIRDVQAEIYKLVDERARVSLGTRLTNKRRRVTLLLVACLSAESVPIMLGLIAAAGTLAAIKKAAHGWIRPMGGKPENGQNLTPLV